LCLKLHCKVAVDIDTGPARVVFCVAHAHDSSKHDRTFKNIFTVLILI
jgi:hypothetical protein